MAILGYHFYKGPQIPFVCLLWGLCQGELSVLCVCIVHFLISPFGSPVPSSHTPETINWIILEAVNCSTCQMWNLQKSAYDCARILCKMALNNTDL